MSVACANLDKMTGGVRAEAARVDPAAGRPVGIGRGERLLRRVLAGTDPSSSGPSPSGAADGPLRHAVHLPSRPGRPVDWPEWVPHTVRCVCFMLNETEP